MNLTLKKGNVKHHDGFPSVSIKFCSSSIRVFYIDNIEFLKMKFKMLYLEYKLTSFCRVESLK